MIPILSLLVVLSLSILVTRIASVALAHTGLSMEAARFQARSAFTGVGFTTSESETLVNHPVRRRVLLILMLCGNAGIVSAMSSLLLTGMSFGEGAAPIVKIVTLVAGIAALWAVAMSDFVDRQLRRLISWALRRYTRIPVTDFANLLHLTGEYRVRELLVREGDWLASATLGDLRLRGEGVLVLGIERAEGTFVGTPDGDTRVHPGDTVIVYGRTIALDRLDDRRSGRAGDAEHREACAEQREVKSSEELADTAS